jgi:hypothetical protein
MVSLGFFKKALLVFLPVQWLIYSWLLTKPILIEKYYIPFIFKPLSRSLSFIFSIFPFSVGLAFSYFVLPILLIYFWGRFWSKKKVLKNIVINILAWFSALYFVFMMTWGLAYAKIPLADLQGLNTQNIQKKEVEALCNELITKANNSRQKLRSDQTLSENNNAILIKADQVFNQKFGLSKSYKYNLKPVLGSGLMSYMHTSGMYFFLTGEANVNTNLLAFEVPSVACHELAHQQGFASENEASYLGFLACESTNDELFKYSAYEEAMWRSLRVLWRLDSISAKAIHKHISPSVLTDSEVSRKRWLKYQNPIDKYIIKPFYDFFLKSNGVEAGSGSYDMVVDLLVAERRKRATFIK